MPIPVRFFTVAIKKSSVRKFYPGGIDGFLTKYPYAVQDHYLFGLSAMSGGDAQQFLDELTAAGLDLPTCCAVGDMFGGAIDPHPDIEFSKATGDFMFPTREARLVRDDPDVMAQEGARLLGVIMARGWVLDVPEGC